jgi:hypothetical protein
VTSFKVVTRLRKEFLCLVDETVAGLRKLGVEAMEVRKPEQLEGLAGLIIPGGESTTMAKLAEHYHLVSHNLTLKSNFLPCLVKSKILALEQLHRCSVRDAANQNWMNKSLKCQFVSSKWFWLSIFAMFAEVDKKAQQSLTTAVDWLHSLIGPGGLLFVVPSPSFSFVGGVGKKQITKLGCEKYFCKVTC